MASAAVTGGMPDPSIVPVPPRLRLHAEGSRVAVVHAPGEEPSLLSQQLRDSNFEVNVVPVGRSMVDQLLEMAPDLVVIGHSAGAFDVTRVCHDLSASLTARIVVVSAGESAGLGNARASSARCRSRRLPASLDVEGARACPNPGCAETTRCADCAAVASGTRRRADRSAGARPVHRRCTREMPAVAVPAARRARQACQPGRRARHAARQRVGRRAAHRRSAPGTHRHQRASSSSRIRT